MEVEQKISWKKKKRRKTISLRLDKLPDSDLEVESGMLSDGLTSGLRTSSIIVTWGLLKCRISRASPNTLIKNLLFNKQNPR